MFVVSKVSLYWKYLLSGVIVAFNWLNVEFVKYVDAVLPGPTNVSPEQDESSQVLTWAWTLATPR